MAKTRKEKLTERKRRLAERKKKLEARNKRLKAHYQDMITRASPPPGAEEMEKRLQDLRTYNVRKGYGGMINLARLWQCSVPLSINPYRGCANGCKMCYINHFIKSRIGREVSFRDRSAYAVGEAGKLEKYFQASVGARPLSHFSEKQGDRFIAEFFAHRVPVHMSSTTDPFMALEKQCKVTWDILTQLRRYQYPVVISTKGGPVFEAYFNKIVALPHKVVQISLASVHDEVVEKYESPIISATQRLEYIRKLADAGVYVVVRRAPFICNGEEDSPEEALNYARTVKEAGAQFVSFEPLHARQGYGVQLLAEASPELGIEVEKFTPDLYEGTHLSYPLEDYEKAAATFIKAMEEVGLDYGTHPTALRVLSVRRFFHHPNCCYNPLEVGDDAFQNYYKGTYQELWYRAAQVFEKYHKPVLVQRVDLDKIWAPETANIPRRGISETTSMYDIKDAMWEEGFLLEPPFFWPSTFRVPDEYTLPEDIADYDERGFLGVVYYPNLDEEWSPQRDRAWGGFYTLDEDFIPWFYLEPKHPWWQKRVKAARKLRRQAKEG